MSYLTMRRRRGQKIRKQRAFNMANVKLADGRIIEANAEGLAPGDQVFVSPDGKAALLRPGGQAKEATMANEIQGGEKAGRRVKLDILAKLRELKDKLDAWLADYKGVLDWAAYEDGGWFNAPGGPTSPLMRTFKSKADGKTWLLNWSMNAFMDKDQEIFGTKAIEDFVDRHAADDKKGEFWFWHIPGTKFADIKWQASVGRFLVEAGPFDDTEVGRLFEKVFTEHPKSHPAVAPGGWGSSPGYVYLGLDRMDKQYEWFEKYETSVLPNSVAANPHNPPPQVLPKEESMNNSQKAALVALVGEKWATEIEQLGETKTKELEMMQVAFKAAAEGDATPAETKVEVEPTKIEPTMTDAMAQAKKQGDGIADELKGMAEELRQVANALPEPQARQRLLTLADDVAGEAYPYPSPYGYAQAEVGRKEGKLSSLADEVRAVADGLKDSTLAKRLSDLADKLVGLEKSGPQAEAYPAPEQKAQASPLPEAVSENIAEDDKAGGKPPTLKGLGQQLRMIAGQVEKSDADAGAKLAVIAEVLVGMTSGKYSAPQEAYPVPQSKQPEGNNPSLKAKKEAGMADELATMNPNTATLTTATIPAVVTMATAPVVETGQKEQAAPVAPAPQPDPQLAKLVEMMAGLQANLSEVQGKLKAQEESATKAQAQAEVDKYEPFGWIPGWKAVSVIGQRDALVRQGTKMAEAGPAEKARPVTGVDFLDELILASDKGGNTEHPEAVEAQ
jgi:hypothetical protein